jgi:hypothetical protein
MFFFFPATISGCVYNGFCFWCIKTKHIFYVSCTITKKQFIRHKHLFKPLKNTFWRHQQLFKPFQTIFSPRKQLFKPCFFTFWGVKQLFKA